MARRWWATPITSFHAPQRKKSVVLPDKLIMVRRCRRGSRQKKGGCRCHSGGIGEYRVEDVACRYLHAFTRSQQFASRYSGFVTDGSKNFIEWKKVRPCRNLRSNSYSINGSCSVLQFRSLERVVESLYVSK